MGMYDTVKINTDKLPVSDQEKARIGNAPGWQTKDLYCEMTEIYITDEGELKIMEFELEVVPKEQRPYPNAKGLMSLQGSLREVNKRFVTVNYRGCINFYGHIGDDWYEFMAKFTDGKLVSIEGGKKDLDDLF